jgi:hypothetical protein
MSIEITWYKENRILYSRYVGELTMDAMRQAIRQATKMVLAQSHPVPHIVDFREMLTVHNNLKDFAEIGADLKGIDKRNWVIILGVTGIPKFIASFITNIAGLNCKMADTLEEARAFAESVAPVDSTSSAADTGQSLPLQ